MQQKHEYKSVTVGQDRKDTTYHDVIPAHSTNGCRLALRNPGRPYRLVRVSAPGPAGL